MADKIIGVLLIAGFAFAFYLAFQAFQVTPSRTRRKKRRSWWRRQPKAHPLQGQLLMLLHGDLGAASRLLNGVRNKNPGMSNTWYYERVISDLERDRR